MKRTNLARTGLLLGISLALSGASLGCAAPDAVPGLGAGGSSTGPTTGAGGPSTVVLTEVSWSRTFGDMAGNTQRGRDLIFDARSNTLVTTVDFDNAIDVVGLSGTPLTSLEARDALVLRYPADGGVPLWGARIGGLGDQYRATTAVDVAGNVIVAGGFFGTIDFAGQTLYSNLNSHDVYVAKLDPDGKELWVKAFGDGDVQFATDVAVDDEGNIIVVGLAQGQIDFGAGPLAPVSDRDLFVAKLDPGGNPIWGVRPGRAAETDYRNPTISIISIGGGKTVVTGASEGLVAFPPLALSAKGDGDAFFAVLDADGKGVAGESFGEVGQRQRGYGVAVGPKGDIAITGEMSGKVNFGGPDLESKGGTDAFVAIFDPAGKHRWSRRFGGPATQSGRGVAFDGEGNVLLTGLYAGVIEFFGENAFINVDLGNTDWDGYVAKLDPSGAVVWAMDMRGPQSQFLSSIVALSDGSPVVAGWYETEIEPSGAQALGSTGGADGFIMSFAP